MAVLSEQTKNVLMQSFMKLLDGPMTLPKAIAIAVVAHGTQEDKGKNAYIRHPLRVMEQLGTEDEMICGVLHDAVEDTFLSLPDLENLGMTSSQLKIVDALTKRDGLDHEEYLQNIEKSPVARKIKILDMKDNARLDRLKNRKLTEKDVERFQRYITDLYRLGAFHAVGNGN